jgi:HPt (histidine-containing phosphotransfer) domain-containing protein
VESAVCRQLGVEGQGRTLLDVRDLFERSGESPRRSLLILRSFMGCYQRVLDELSEAERAGSAMELARVAHALKGLTAEVGAWELSSKAAHLETLGQANRVDDLLPLVPELKGDTEVVAAAIESVLQSFKNE